VTGDGLDLQRIVAHSRRPAGRRLRRLKRAARLTIFFAAVAAEAAGSETRRAEGRT